MPRGSFTSVDTGVRAEGYAPRSPEQLAVWNELDSTRRNVIVEAVAGSGKTYTGVEWCKRAKVRTAFVAFNKHIATELQNRLQGCANVEAMTYHSLGFRMVRAAVRQCQVDQYKVDAILDTVALPFHNDYLERTAKYRIKHLTGLAKQYGVRARTDLENLVDHHDVDLSGGIEECVYEWVPKILDRCKGELGTVDFDDMVWLPKELGLRCLPYDTMLIDEAQDTNLSQQWIALNSAKRLVVIGDTYQSIYGFRGSDHLSMQRIENALRPNVVRLPLSVTRRCPQSHVRLAQRIVPQIKALDTAGEGVIRTVETERALGEMGPGDLILCRVNAELLGTAYKLLKRGVKAVVRGRDVGEGLSKLIDKAVKKAGDADLTELLRTAGEITGMEAAKYDGIPHGRGQMRAANTRDRYDCLIQLSEGAGNVPELRGVITKLFADFQDDGKPNTAVVLGTVHRTKGLEADRVFVLKPELIPHPMARQEWERAQENNLGYVAVTRAKRELVWVGGESPLFGAVSEHVSTYASTPANIPEPKPAADPNEWKEKLKKELVRIKERMDREANEPAEWNLID